MSHDFDAIQRLVLDQRRAYDQISRQWRLIDDMLDRYGVGKTVVDSSIRAIEEQARQFDVMKSQLGLVAEAFRFDHGALRALGLEAGRNAFELAAMLPELDRQLGLHHRWADTLAHSFEIPAFFRDFVFPDRDALGQGHQEFTEWAETLGRAGWTFSMRMAPVDIHELAEKFDGTNVAEIDLLFLEFYEAEDGAEFRHLKRRLLKRKRLATWRPLIKECLWSYRKQRYRIAVPALLSMIEGLVAEAAGAVRERNVKVPAVWRKVTRPATGLMLEIQWCAVSAFLDTLWQRSEFSDPSPAALNRHRVLHGRHPEVGARADALRLLAAVDFIADAAAGVEGMTRRAARRQAVPEAADQPTASA